MIARLGRSKFTSGAAKSPLCAHRPSSDLRVPLASFMHSARPPPRPSGLRGSSITRSRSIIPPVCCAPWVGGRPKKNSDLKHPRSLRLACAIGTKQSGVIDQRVKKFPNDKSGPPLGRAFQSTAVSKWTSGRAFSLAADSPLLRFGGRTRPCAFLCCCLLLVQMHTCMISFGSSTKHSTSMVVNPQ